MSFKIFPCKADKKPLIDNWQSEATSDPAKIELWRQTFGEKLAYFGVPTGPENGIIALDVDIKGNGFETIKNLQVPNTMYQKTPSGGAHYIYKYPQDGRSYGNKVKFKPGLDTRAAGGYIIWYGANGYPLTDAPQWLLEECVKRTEQPTGAPISVAPSIAQAMIDSCLEAIADAGEGERNNTLNREAFRIGQLVASGAITREYAITILTQAGIGIGLEASEIKATVGSAIGGGHSKPMTGPFNEPPVVTMTMLPPPPTVESWTPKPLSLFDLLDTTNLKRPQLFEHWSTEDIHLTAADGGVGKSTLKLYEAVCLALGAPFLGFPCKQAGKTLYITGEDSEKKLAAMVGQICKQMGILDDPVKVQTILDSITIKKDDDLCLVTKDKGTGFLVANTVAMDKILHTVKELKPKMVVFDPIASFWGSEAALNDMTKAISKFMSKLANESNACVEMINHIGKQSSSTKDMSQFAGRGGSGLPSHARVSRVMAAVTAEEFTELTGDTLPENQSAILVNVNKFSDGSPLFNKKFLVIREGYLFTRRMLDEKKVREEKKESDDLERVMNYVKDVRSQGKYPTKSLVVAYFMSHAEKLSESRVRHALNLLLFTGHGVKKLKKIVHPDATEKEQAYVITNMNGEEA